MDGPRIVLAEDEAIVGIEIKNSLQRLGYRRTDLVASGEEVIEELEVGLPDLILMDVNLKGDVDGIEATNKILDEHEIPIVFITAYASESVLDRIHDTDALGYIIKPIHESDLETVADRVLEGESDKRLQRGTFFFSSLSLPVTPFFPSIEPQHLKLNSLLA